MHTIWNFKDSVSIKYQSGLAKKIEIKTVYLNKFYDTKSIKNCWNKQTNFSLKFENKIAILRLNTFNSPDHNNFIKFYNQIFDSIKTRKSEKLILDISENPGGSDINWMILLKYFVKKPLLLNCNTPIINITDLLNDLKIDQAKIDTTKFFNGKLYLITGSETFSSAVRFADVVKTNGLSEKIYGKETKGQATHYGEVKKYFLPNTKLQINVSSKLFFSLGCSYNKNGIIPDIVLNENTPEEYLDNKDNENTIRKVLEIIE